MRTVNEIIIDAKDGKVPTHEECFWAMLALSGRLHFTWNDLKNIAEAYECLEGVQNEEEEKKVKKKLFLRLHMHARNTSIIWNERTKFGNIDPQVWLGDMGNPFNPETIKFHDMAKKILDKAIAKQQEK